MARKFVWFNFVVILMVVTIPTTATPIHAQDESPAVCDATLILFLSLSEFEGYQPSELALNVDYGQWTPFFTIMDMVDMSEFGENQAERVADQMEMAPDEADAMLQEMMSGMGMDMEMSMYTTLEVKAVEGEDERCTALRQELTDWWHVYIINQLSATGSMHPE